MNVTDVKEEITLDPKLKQAVALSLWLALREAPEGESREERDAAWEADKPTFLPKATLFVRKLEARGFSLTSVS